jgi:branched-chain amino acid transport system substrate-binding protein
MKFIDSARRAAVLAAALAIGALGPLGHAQAQGVTKTSIVIGQSVVLAGLGSSLARPYQEGAKLYFDRVNAAGGVNGRKLDVVTLDDNGRPVTTVANTKKLLDQGVLCLFGYYGSPQVTAAYPLIKDSDVLLFAPMSAADEFRGPAFPNIYTLRPGYSDEAAAITKHAETLGARKLAIIHATDPESLEALAAAERTTVKLGAKLVAKAAANSSGNVANAVDSSLAASPDSVLVIGDANGAAGIVRDLRAKGFRGPIYGFSNTGESLLAEELGPEGAGVVVVRVVPKTDNPTSIVARELQADAAAAKAGKPNVYMMEGYIAARVLVEALRRIPGEPTRAKLKRALEGLHDVNVGSFRVDYSKGRVGSKLVELALIDSQGRVRE